jgi:hypothetical protein
MNENFHEDRHHHHHVVVKMIDVTRKKKWMDIEKNDCGSPVGVDCCSPIDMFAVAAAAVVVDVVC